MEWPAHLPLVRGGGVTISGVCLVPWKIERKLKVGHEPKSFTLI